MIANPSSKAVESFLDKNMGGLEELLPKKKYRKLQIGISLSLSKNGGGLLAVAKSEPVLQKI